MQKIISIVILLAVITAGIWLAVRNKHETVPVPTDTTVSTDTGVKKFTVEGSNFKFSPTTIEVNKGDTVEITFKNTQGLHDLVIDEFNVATKQLNGGEEETITFVADKTGTFEYYCSVMQHRAMGMVGTLVVK